MTDYNIEKLLEAVRQFSETIYETTTIFVGNPFDLIEIDMKKIPSNCFFISDHCVEQGKMLKVNNDELKRALYGFIEEHPDRVFRGRL